MLKLYNTMGRNKEVFTPIMEGEVRMYVCGITPYEGPHLGHGRCYVIFDVLRRYLESKGLKVRHIQNTTDIDDKIIQRANECGEEIELLVSRYIDEFFTCMDTLNIKRASCYPKVTEHIQDIIEVAAVLLEKGFAYRVDGDLYFDTKRFRDYGILSGQSPEDLLAGARVEVDPRKRDPADFAIWKEAKPGEPSWRSPWGFGRPGWHIECSVIATKHLGTRFDIHGGGRDLIFPHHENEIAQSWAYSGEFPAKYWIHNGFVMVGKEKMSKSLGNVFTLKGLFSRYSGEAIRMFLLGTHYRSPIEFRVDLLDGASSAIERLYTVVDVVDWELGGAEFKGTGVPPKIERMRERFNEAMDDDLNTPRALGVIFDLVREMNNAIKNGGPREFLVKGRDLLVEKAKILGLFKDLRPDERKEIYIERLIKEREVLRSEKRWEEADRIRRRLRDMGVILEDTPHGTRFRFARFISS
jgi:cysteinyl-tRNA synthetase